jgi:hypothetical protein
MKTFGQGQRTVRVTASKLPVFHGKDRGKDLVVELLRDDLIAIRPIRSRSYDQIYSVLDIYDWMVRTTADKVRRDKQLARRKTK